MLLKGRHEGYITWEEFERNQRAIAENATAMGSSMVKGAVRRGDLLLAGLLRCAHCGRKLHVFYSGAYGRYQCYGANTNHGAKRCISLASSGADRAVVGEILRVLKPLGVDAALKAIKAQTSETSAAQRQLVLALQQAGYDIGHARRQYDAVDPANRLVADELGRRWNEALLAAERTEGEIADLIACRPAPLGEEERQHLMRLGADLEYAWRHPAATSVTRKRILRAALNEIIVRKDGGSIDMILHWQGGDHTVLNLKIRVTAAGHYRWQDREDLPSRVRELARLMPDREIARLLNRCGVKTGYGNSWSEPRVQGFRQHHKIDVFKPGELAERGQVTLEEAAKTIGVATMTVFRMIKLGNLAAHQVCKGAPGS